MFAFIRNWLDNRIIQQSSVSDEQWQQAFNALPLLQGLTQDEQQSLRELAILLMHRKAFEGAHDLVVTRAMAMIIALQACLPILKLGLNCYRHWYSIIVYPAGFISQRVVTDESGVEHVQRDQLTGEAWQTGPVILAWDAALQGGAIDGHNLVIHEFAHKLDMQNGVANGFPPLHTDMDGDAWAKAFSDGFDDLSRRCEQHKHIGIDCYAATSPAEFFAVLSEVFFERPGLIIKYYPDIYTCLKQYYRQDPLQRLVEIMSIEWGQ